MGVSPIHYNVTWGGEGVQSFLQYYVIYGLPIKLLISWQFVAYINLFCVYLLKLCVIRVVLIQGGSLPLTMARMANVVHYPLLIGANINVNYDVITTILLESVSLGQQHWTLWNTWTYFRWYSIKRNLTLLIPINARNIQSRVRPLLTEPPNLVKNVCSSMLNVEWTTWTTLSKVISTDIWLLILGALWISLVLNKVEEHGGLHWDSPSWK